jgi:serine/threonine protein phosphatase PrpC
VRGDLDLESPARSLLCSDGLSDLVPVAEMERLPHTEPDETRAVKALRVAAMNASGRDNISVMLVSPGA